MPKFIVWVTKQMSDSVAIRVEADDGNAAMAKALQRAVVDFSLKWEAEGDGITYRVAWDEDDGSYD